MFSYVSFRNLNIPSISVKNCIGVLMRILFNLYINFGRMTIFIILIIVIYENGRFSIFWYPLQVHFQYVKVSIIQNFYFLHWIYSMTFI